MIPPVPFTVAGQADIRNRLNADGVAALGLAAPLLSQAWTQALPTFNPADLSLTVTANWFSPIAGVLINEPNPRGLGLSRFDGTPWPSGGPIAVVFRIHPQARLRLERLMVANLQPAGATPLDQSIRPVPAIILISNPSATFSTPEMCSAGLWTMPAGTVYMFDDHGLPVDPLAFAGAIAAVLVGTPAAGTPTTGTPAPAGNPAGTPAAIANIAPGQFIHAIDLHGRPWQAPPGQLGGVSLYSGPVGARVQVDSVGNGQLHAWATNPPLVLAGDLDTNGMISVLSNPTLTRFGWHPLGRINTTPLTWPAAGPQVPVRDTLRVVVCDPVLPPARQFECAGSRRSIETRFTHNRSPTCRKSGKEARLCFCPTGRSVLGWMGQVILNLQGGNPAAPFNTGPMFAASPVFEGSWPFPTLPGTGGRLAGTAPLPPRFRAPTPPCWHRSHRCAPAGAQTGLPAQTTFWSPYRRCRRASRSAFILCRSRWGSAWKSNPCCAAPTGRV